MLEPIINPVRMAIAGLALLAGCATTSSQAPQPGVTETAKEYRIVGCGSPGADSFMGWNEAEMDVLRIGEEYLGKTVFPHKQRRFYNQKTGCHCLEYIVPK